MALPAPDKYHESIQHPSLCFMDAALKNGQVKTNARGTPVVWSGNFAAVYQVACSGQKNWAVKCFTREVPGLQQRYQAISSHLSRHKLSFMVESEYQDTGILVQGQHYPILKMRWVEGFRLDEFINDYLLKPNVLLSLAEKWLKMAEQLRQAQIAHGDLQHGNVLLVRAQGGVSLKLVDYDGMYVPALAGTKSGEVGHPNFQHPKRGDNPFHAEVDRFSHLVIYTSLCSLASEGRELWDRYNNDDNLLFREADFKAPQTSQLFQHLWRVQNSVVHALTGHLVLASLGLEKDVPLLIDLIDGRRPPTLSAQQENQVNSLLSKGVGKVRPVPQIAASKLLPAPTRAATSPVTASARPKSLPFHPPGPRSAGAQSQPPSTRPSQPKKLSRNPSNWLSGILGSTNNLAKVSMLQGIAALLSFLFCGILSLPIAGVLGYLAIRNGLQGRSWGNKSQAMAGIICGICSIGIAITILCIIIYVLVKKPSDVKPNLPAPAQNKPVDRVFEERTLGSKWSAGKLLAAASKDAKLNGDRVQLREVVKDSPTQRWQMIPVGENQFFIVSVANGLALEANDDTVRLGSLSKGQKQQWRLEKAGDYVKIINHASGKYLRAQPEDIANDAGRIQLSDGTDADYCLWKLF